MPDRKEGGKVGRSQAVLEYLVRAIASGQYKENQKLPTERELADICGVSRSSVREALSILAALDIVDRRIGDGTYVRCCNEKLLNLALQIATHNSELRDIFELQRILEAGVAELAARRMNSECIATLREALSEMEEAAEKGDIKSYFAADRKFHLAIATSTGNPLIYQHILALMNHMDQPLWRIVKTYFIQHRNSYVEESLSTHRRLLAALEMHDTSQARRVMEEHFERVENEMFGSDS
jgi:GntR family transcriptional repressor for pyruvate dehydrogenase complex